MRLSVKRRSRRAMILSTVSQKSKDETTTAVVACAMMKNLDYRHDYLFINKSGECSLEVKLRVSVFLLRNLRRMGRG